METLGLSCPVTAVLLLDHPRLVVAAFGRRLRVWASTGEVAHSGESEGEGGSRSASAAEQSRGDRGRHTAGAVGAASCGLVVGGPAGPEPAGEVVVFPDTSRIHGIRLLTPGDHADTAWRRGEGDVDDADTAWRRGEGDVDDGEHARLYS
jgi:hypothetical protein